MENISNLIVEVVRAEKLKDEIIKTKEKEYDVRCEKAWNDIRDKALTIINALKDAEFSHNLKMEGEHADLYYGARGQASHISYCGKPFYIHLSQRWSDTKTAEYGNDAYNKAYDADLTDFMNNYCLKEEYIEKEFENWQHQMIDELTEIYKNVNDELDILRK